MKIIPIFFLIIYTSSNIILRQQNLSRKPESKKLEISFFRGSNQPIRVQSNNKIQNVQSSTGYQIIPQQNQPAEEPINIDNNEVSNNQQIDQFSDQVEDIDPFSMIFGGLLGDVDVDEVTDTNEETPKKSKNIEIANNQLKELEEELKQALEQTNGQSPIAVNQQNLSTIVSYLEHLDYIHKHEKDNIEEIGKPPKVPDHLRAPSQQVIIQDQFVQKFNSNTEQDSVQEQQDIIQEQPTQDYDINQQLNEIIKQVQDAIDKDENNQEESQKNINYLKNEIMDVKERISKLNELINNLINEKEEDGQSQLQEELLDLQDQLQTLNTEVGLNQTENEIAITDEQLQNQMISDLNSGKEEEVDKLAEDIDKLELKNDKLLQKIEEYDSLEKIQARIVQIEQELEALGDSPTEEETILALHQELALIKLKEQEETQKIENLEQEQTSKIVENVSDQQQTQQKDEMFKQEFTISSFSDFKDQINLIKTNFESLFTGLPSSKDAIPTDIEDLKSSLELSQKFIDIMESYISYKSESTTSIEKISNSISKIEEGYEYGLVFYEVYDQYQEYLSNIDSSDTIFIETKENFQKQITNFTQILQTLKIDLSSLSNLGIIINETIDPFFQLYQESEDNDEQKAALAIQILPNLIDLQGEFKTNISNIISEIIQVQNIKQEVDVEMSQLQKLSTGEIKAFIDPLEEKEDIQAESETIQETKDSEIQTQEINQNEQSNSEQAVNTSVENNNSNNLVDNQAQATENTGENQQIETNALRKLFRKRSLFQLLN